MDIDEFKQRKVKRGYVWLKLFTDLVDEPEFMQLTDKAKAVYFEVYILAGRSDAGGLVTSSDKPARIEQLAWSLRRSGTDLQTALDELQRAGLVDLDGDQVMVCRFGSEQGPSADEKRAQWREWQRESRAKARGEKLPDVPDQDQNPEPDQDQKTESEADQDQTKTKRVSRKSGESQARVRTDSIVEDVTTFGNDVLNVWNQLHGDQYKPVQKFWDMVQYWHEQGVTIRHARQALIQTRDQAETPMYARELAVQIHNDDPELLAKTQAERFRELYRAQKQASQADQTGGDE